jgi:hypothetical protein
MWKDWHDHLVLAVGEPVPPLPNAPIGTRARIARRRALRAELDAAYAAARNDWRSGVTPNTLAVWRLEQKLREISDSRTPKVRKTRRARRKNGSHK